MEAQRYGGRESKKVKRAMDARVSLPTLGAACGHIKAGHVDVTREISFGMWRSCSWQYHLAKGEHKKYKPSVNPEEKSETLIVAKKWGNAYGAKGLSGAEKSARAQASYLCGEESNSSTRME